jgi:hypothetical protein
LLAVGCSSLGEVRNGGGATGAQEASELIGCFIHVATVELSKSWCPRSCWPRCFLDESPRFDRLLRLAKVVEGGTTASKPEEVPSSLKATHSLLRLLATMFCRSKVWLDYLRGRPGVRKDLPLRRVRVTTVNDGNGSEAVVSIQVSKWIGSFLPSCLLQSIVDCWRETKKNPR